MKTLEQKAKKNVYMKEYLKLHKEKINSDRKKRYLTNIDRIKEQTKKWRQSNREKKSQIDKEYQLKNKDKIRENKRRYYLSKREEFIKKSTEYTINRRKVDPIYRLKDILRTRIIVCLVQRKYKKSKTTEELIGASIEKVREHLESQFKEGMTWSNHGTYGWHIDHIVPLATAKDEEETIKLFHFTNLQPLWAKDNLIKGSSVTS